MTDSVFVDTDVLLDLYIQRQPHHDLALRLFTRLKRDKTRCYTSGVVIANIYYILTRLMDRQYAIDKVRKLRRLVSIATLDQAMIDAAVASGMRDFEDSIQLHCAIGNRIKTLITRNTADYPKGLIRVADPGQYLSGAEVKKSG